MRIAARRGFCAWALAITCWAVTSPVAVANASAPAERPNILLIIADDLGYSDLGAYGGDIETPNIDALAQQGARFSQFHTAPMCAPTRAMLFSGNNNHVAGMAAQGKDGLVDFPLRGYENSLSDRVVPFPRLLAEAGYDTYIVGKWHLGEDAATSPKAAGFIRSYTLLAGAGTHYDARGYKEEGSTWWLDDDFASYPDGRYSTEVYTERLIEFIESGRENGRPFLAVAAYTSPHWPLQVPEEYLDRYSGRYDAGYDVLREQRFESLKEAGIIPPTSVLPPRNEAIRPWDELDPDEQRKESRKMELYAAMVENLDDHVGRLLRSLRDNGLYENTLIVFMSDNGAAGEDFFNSGFASEYLQENFDNSYENMGKRGSFVSYGPQWAEAGSAPFRRYKGATLEGGLIAPLIAAGPGVKKRGGVVPAYFTVMDLAPTFLALAGARYPVTDGVEPMLGASILGLLSGDADAVHDDEYVTALFHHGRAYIRQGNWKLVTESVPFDESDFRMYDLATDPGEVDDLAGLEPEKYEQLIDLWRTERKRLGIVLPEDL